MFVLLLFFNFSFTLHILHVVNVFSQQTQLEWENPLDLSILVNGGKENNNDSLSSRE